jgi:stage II sporulation protein R
MKTKNKILTVELAVLTAFIITCVISTMSFASACEDIRNSVLRMHVVANSDSEEDQRLKLKVRDAVLEAGKEYFDNSESAAQAEEKLIPVKDELERVAKKVVEENGYDYDVKVNIGNAYFPTKTYDGDVTLPAGEYEAVNVIIGSGRGHNWWCVMFPPMCLPAAESDTELDEVLSEREYEIVKSNPKFEPRFKIVEWYEKFIKNN